jgi:hypothetical protein
MDFDVVDEPLIKDDALQHYRVLIWLEGDVFEAGTLQKIRSWVEQGGVLLRLGSTRVSTVENSTTEGDALLGFAAQQQLHDLPLDQFDSLDFKNTAFLRHAAARHHADAHTQIASEIPSGARPLITVNAASNKGSICCVIPRGKGWVITWATPFVDRSADPQDDSTRLFEELARDVVYNLSALDASKHNATEVDTAFDGVYATLMSSGEVFLLNPNPTPQTAIAGRLKVELPPVSCRTAVISN